MMRSGASRMFCMGLAMLGLFVALGAGMSQGATFQWSGAGGNDNWTTPGNWTNAAAPANPTADTIAFSEADNGGTTVLDPPSSNIWHTGALWITNGTSSSDFTQLHDLNGKTLAIDGGDVVVGYDIWNAGVTNNWARGVFTNGTLQIGAPGALRNINIGYGPNANMGELKIASNAILNAYLNTVTFGSENGGGGTWDLRGATVAGDVLNMINLKMCVNGNGNISRRDMFILLDSATHLNEIHIATNCWLGYAQMARVRVGDPSNSYKLPPNLNFTIGSPAARGGNFWMNANPYWGPDDVLLQASSGGQFVAYVTDVLIHPGYFGTGTPLTTFDISAMTNVLIDCLGEFSIGKANSDNTMGYNTKVRLCRGRVACKDLVVGTSLVSGSSALLEINATLFAVTNTATLGQKALLTNNVAGFSGGLDLSSNATLSVTSPGKIMIAFTATQDGADPNPVYWGLRWAGNHQGDLGALRAAGTLVWTNTVAGKYVAINYDGASNVTYVALTNNAAPIALPRNFTLELNPPSYTNVVIAVADVDSGSYDPTGLAITNRFITCAADTRPGDSTVTLDALGVYSVWLTVVNTNGVAGSNFCTVTVQNPLTGITNSLTWDGGARMTVDPRSEWLWAMNWTGDVPPINPTPATLLFGDLGVGTNALDADRGAGGLTINNTAGTHVFDLRGKTLSITNGNVTVNSSAGGLTAAAVFTNGTLRIGATTALRDVTLGSGSSAYFDGNLTLRPGTVFDPHIGTLTIGGGDGGRGYLDLRGVVISGGVFEVRDIQTGVAGNGARGTRPCEIRMDETTAITEFRVGRYLDIAYGEVSQSRIGNPNNSWRFPTNLNFTVGSAGQRGRINIGIGYWYSNDGFLGATTGGTFTAYLTDMKLSRASAAGPTVFGVLDLNRMTNCLLDVANAVDIGNGGANEWGARGKLTLPPGLAVVNKLYVGIPIGTNNNLLELNGTVFNVTNVCTIGMSGVVSNNVRGSSGGLNLSAAATLSVSNNGVISIVYTASRPAGGSGPYWGLRWAGHHEAELTALRTAGKLIWSRGPIGEEPSIFYTQGATHVGYPLTGTLFAVR